MGYPPERTIDQGRDLGRETMGTLPSCYLKDTCKNITSHHTTYVDVKDYNLIHKNINGILFILGRNFGKPWLFDRLKCRMLTITSHCIVEVCRWLHSGFIMPYKEAGQPALRHHQVFRRKIQKHLGQGHNTGMSSCQNIPHNNSNQ